MLRTRHFTKHNGDSGMFSLTLHVFWVETLESYMFTVVIVPGDRENHGFERSWTFSANKALELGNIDGKEVSYASITREAVDKLCEDMEDYGDEEANISEWRMRNSITDQDFDECRWVCYDGDEENRRE